MATKSKAKSAVKAGKAAVAAKRSGKSVTPKNRAIADALATVAGNPAAPDSVKKAADPAVKAAFRAGERSPVYAAYQVLAEGLHNGESIPVKPLSIFARDVRPIAELVAQQDGKTANRLPVRVALAVALALAEQGVALRDGAKFARRFDVTGKPSCIENGGIKRAVRCGALGYSGKPGEETLTIKSGYADIVRGLVGEDKLRRAGIKS